MYIPGLNATTDTSKLLSDLKLTQDQIVTAKSFIEFLHDAQMKIKKDEMNDKIKVEKLEKEINQRIDSEIKSGSKLPLEIYNKIADEEVLKKINEVNESIRRLSAKRAYGDFSMIKLPVRARINFAMNAYHFKYKGCEAYTYIDKSKNGYVIYETEAHEYDDPERPIYPYFMSGDSGLISREWADALVFDTKEDAEKEFKHSGFCYPQICRIKNGIINLKDIMN